MNHLEKLAQLEIVCDNMHEDVIEIKKLLKDQNKKFASKWTENFLIAVIVLAFAAIINSFCL